MLALNVWIRVLIIGLHAYVKYWENIFEQCFLRLMVSFFAERRPCVWKRPWKCLPVSSIENSHMQTMQKSLLECIFGFFGGPHNWSHFVFFTVLAWDQVSDNRDALSDPRNMPVQHEFRLQLHSLLFLIKQCLSSIGSRMDDRMGPIRRIHEFRQRVSNR